MSVARTARRRRRQAKLGAPGLEQVFGKRRTPHFPAALTKEKSAKLLAKKLETIKRLQQGKKK